MLEPHDHLAVGVADIRRSGTYYPLSRDAMNMEPCLGQIRSIFIKAQHNCRSDRKVSNGLRHAPIKHEYCIVFEKTN